MPNSEQIYIKTPEFRVSWPSVFKKTAYQNRGEGKYKLNCQFPKGTDLTELKEACKAAAIKAFGTTEGIQWPFRSGNEKLAKMDEEARAKAPMLKDIIFIIPTTKTKPQIVDQDAKTLITEEDGSFYAGCWAKAIVNAYSYVGDGGKQCITFGLGNIQKVRNDEAFGGRPDASTQFEAVATGADDPSNYDGDDMMGSEEPAGLDLT